MPVYVDNAYIKATVPNGERTVSSSWCHMTADTREELDAMALAIGLKTKWIQCEGKWSEHYDLTLPRRAAAVRAGAIEVDSMEHTRNFLLPRNRAMKAAKNEQENNNNNNNN